MTTTANDSGVETSNDSNDTVSLNQNAAGGLAFPQRFDQRSIMQFTTRNELMLFDGGAGGGGGSIIKDISEGESSHNIPTTTTSEATLTFLRPTLSLPPCNANILSTTSNTASSMTFASASPGTAARPASPMSSLSINTAIGNSGSLDLHVPISFLTAYTPTYPASMISPPKHGQHAKSNRAKATRLCGGTAAGLHKHQVPYIRNQSNERKLRLAASLSNVEVLLRLLDAGVNPNSADEYQRSALHLAASRGYTDVVIQLLKYGAKTNAKDSLGNTPLHLAVCSASSFNFNRVVRILLKHGASVQVQDRHGQTPLDLVKSKLSMMRKRRANDQAPESIKMLLDMSVLTALLISTCVREVESAEDMNSLEQRLQQLSTKEVENEADALLAKVEQLTLKN